VHRRNSIEVSSIYTPVSKLSRNYHAIWLYNLLGLSHASFFHTFFYFLFISLAQQPKAGQGRLIFEVSRTHTMTRHSRYKFFGRGIGTSKKFVPDYTHIIKERDIHVPVEFEPAIPASGSPQTLTLDHSTTGIGITCVCYTIWCAF
jgi:hypothetical protein